MIVTQQIQVDLTDKKERPSIDAVQGDGAKAVKIFLFAGEEAWAIPEGAAALIRYRKLDGTGGSYDTMPDGSAAYTIDGSAITVRLAPETMTDSGVTQLQVVLRQNGAELAAFTMNLSVEPDPSIDTMDSKDFVNHIVQIRNLFDGLYGQTFDGGGYLGQKIDDLHNRVEPTFVSGTLNSGDGAELAQTDRIRSDFFFHGGRQITVTMPEGVKVRLFFYNADQGYLTESPYHDTCFTISNPGIYARCVAAYTDDSPITDTAALADKVGIFYRGESHDAFRGHIKALGLTAFADCTEEGYYRFAAADIGSITDAPALTTGGILQVYPNSAAGVPFQIITTGSGEIWFRSGTATFVKIVSGVDADRVLFYRGNAAKLGYKNLAQCQQPGYYAFTAEDLCDLSDAPTGLSAGGVLEVAPYGASGVVFQTLRTSGGECWFRWGSNPFVKIVSGLDADRQLCYRGNVVKSGYESLVQCTLPGYYSFTKLDLQTLTDAPPELTGGGALEVRPHAATGQIFQYITDTSGQVWFRYGSNEFAKLSGGGAGGFGPVVKWLALGDSITQGYNSSFVDDVGTIGYDSAAAWATLAAKFNGWELSNQAVGGSGFVAPGTVGDKLNLLAHVTRLQDTLADYELITLFAGVNDWKYDHILGSMADGVNRCTVTESDGSYTVTNSGTESFYANMRGAIELIQTKNPTAKIVVISPLNCCKYGQADTGWGMGYAFANNGTLEDIFRAEREICAYYGIEFVDMLHSGVVNRLNIETVLPDGVHPSAQCHRALAYELSRKIMAGDPAKAEKTFQQIESLEITEDTTVLTLEGFELERFILQVSTTAGSSATAVYADIVTTDGTTAANCYIGAGINTAARHYTVTGKLEGGLTEIYWTNPTANETVGDSLRGVARRVPALGYGTIKLYPTSGTWPLGTKFTLLGIRR